MKFSKCFIVLCLCIAMGACNIESPSIEIGDYENQLAAWNSRNMRDYQLSLTCDDMSGLKQAVVIVRNGIPESSDPPEWLASGEKSTIPEFFSLIMESKNKIKNGGRLSVDYDTGYHYPKSISARFRRRFQNVEPDWIWGIELTPLWKLEKQLEIDIGDYEGQLAAWNSQNMLDYWFEVSCEVISENISEKENGWIYVENGVLYNSVTSSGSPLRSATWPGYTIPKIYSFIREQAQIFKDDYNRDNSKSPSLKVSYNTEYHYPSEIIWKSGSYMSWKFTLTPPYGGEHETEGGEE